MPLDKIRNTVQPLTLPLRVSWGSLSPQLGCNLLVMTVGYSLDTSTRAKPSTEYILGAQ